MTRRRAGFALLPVVLALGLVAALAFALTRESTLGATRASATAQRDTGRYVAEAGLQHALWIASNSSCTGYALPSTPFGAHAYTASFTPGAGSPLAITATGTLASGASHVLKRDEVRAYEPPTTLEIQPDAAAAKDTFVYQWKPDWNYGAVGYVRAISWPPDSDHHGLLDFDVTGSVPAAARILGATLELYFGSASWPGGPISVHRVTRDWVEGNGSGGAVTGGATWNESDTGIAWTTPGGDLDPTPAATTDVGPALGWYTWDVTSLVADWVSGRFPEHGFGLVPGSSSAQAQFSSSDAADATEHPKLTVVYTCECGVGGGGGSLLLDPVDGDDTYLSDGSPSTPFGSSDEIRLSNKTNNQENGLIRFDLGAVPVGATLTSALLEMYFEDIGSGVQNTVSVHRVQSPWTESGATWLEASPGVPWTTAGGDYDPVAVDSVTVLPGVPGYQQWVVTPLVADWVGGNPNHGFLLRAGPDANHADFTTSDSASVAQHPRLSVTWTCGCGGCGGPSDPFYLDEFNQLTCDEAVDWSGSDGTLDWSPTPWEEVGEAPNSCSGNVRVYEDQLPYGVRFGGVDDGLRRPVDLSMFGADDVWLSLLYRRESLDDVAHALRIEASSDGSSWNEIGRIEGPGTDAGYQSASFDLAAFAGAPAFVRLMSENLGFSGGSNKYVFVDDVRIGAGGGPPAGGGSETLPATEDTWIAEATDENYGSDPTLDVGQDAGAKHYRGLVQFDLSAIPADATVTQAKLRLHVNSTFGSKGVDTGVYQLEAAWGEATATWNNTGGGAYNPLEELSNVHVPKDASGWVEWTVPTGLIHEWLDGLSPNHGLILVPTGGNGQKNNKFSVATRDHATAGIHPQLVVDYTTP